MALIKGKQIESINSSQVIESEDKVFVTNESKGLIEKFSEVDGKLNFNGKPIDTELTIDTSNLATKEDLAILATKEDLKGVASSKIEDVIYELKSLIKNQTNLIEDINTKLQYFGAIENVQIMTVNASTDEYTVMLGNSLDTLEAINLVDIPKEAVKYCIQYISVHFCDENGVMLANSNPSGTHTQFPSLGGVDPSKGICDIIFKNGLSIIPVNINFAEVSDAFFEGVNKYVKVDHLAKIDFQIKLLDKNNDLIKTLLFGIEPSCSSKHTHKRAITDAREKIDLIPAIDKLTLEDKHLVEAARASCNRLSSSSIEKLENYQHLLDAEAKIKELESIKL